MKKWNLDKLYTSFESVEFTGDLKKLDGMIEAFNKQVDLFKNYDDKAKKLVNYLTKNIELNAVFEKLYGFAGLTASVESTNTQAIKAMNTVQTKATELTKIETIFSKWLVDYPDLNEDIETNPFLKEHEFHINEVKQNASHLLSDEVESLIAKLEQTGSSSWERLQSLLTSTVEVDYDGKKITLSEVRNLATDKDPKVRKAAYEAELKAYEKINKSVAFSINSIKGEVNTMSKARGFESPLQQTLEKSRMQKATLDAMLEACTDYLPVFRQYFRRKAELLGHKNGLPFYDLFAPVGKSDTKFTIEEANQYILKNFKTFSQELHDLALKAFNEEWVDYTPRPGKVGGAFCSNIHVIRESRVMTNFTGSFSDMITLSHELGHAYHGEQIFKESALNAEYTMPVAETASTFNETIVNKAALKDASSADERIFLLESSIQDYAQVIVDIMSRYYFEKSVFEGRENTVFDENELKELMLDAQRKTYGEGLDPDFMHPYMWLCKPHYYSAQISYYNFPYAFGLLFAKGLYAKYLENKTGFPRMYNGLLQATGKSMVEDTAKIAGIDITKKDFWVSSLELLKEDIDLFLELTK